MRNIFAQSLVKNNNNLLFIRYFRVQYGRQDRYHDPGGRQAN